jgi:hypothetical protein
MPDILYAADGPSPWLVLCHGNAVLAIDADPASALAVELWGLVSADAGPGALLDVLARAGLSTIPGFAYVGGADPAALTALVRGSATVRTSSEGGNRELSGSGVASWVEQVVDGSLSFGIEVGVRSSSSPVLHLRSGTALASVVTTAVTSAAVGLTAPSAIAAAAVPPAPAVAAPPAPALLSPPPPPPPPVDLEETLAVPDLDTEEISVPESSEDLGSAQASANSGYDHLFGETVFRQVEDAARREEEPHGDAPAAGEHTIMHTDLAALRAQRKAAKAAPPPVVAEPAFLLELSTGGTELLDAPLFIGRAPSASGTPGTRIPRLVSINTPNQDISRTHAQISAEGGTVVVTDLHSSNGTTITLPGRPAQRLRAGEPAAVIPGTLIDLGDGATLTLRQLP